MITSDEVEAERRYPLKENSIGYSKFVAESQRAAYIAGREDERAALAAQLKSISERLDDCFEPTVPLTPIISELVPAVRDAIKVLRALASEAGPVEGER